MRRRVWTTVVVTAATLLIASSVIGARPPIAGLIEQIRALPWTVVVLSQVSCVIWLVSLVKLYRSWVVRRNLARVLARFGTPTAVIAKAARLSEDGVAFLTATSGGNPGPLQREFCSCSGNEFTHRQSVPDGSLGESSPGEEMLTTMLDELPAMEAAFKWERGLGEELYRPLSRRLTDVASVES